MVRVCVCLVLLGLGDVYVVVEGCGFVGVWWETVLMDTLWFGGRCLFLCLDSRSEEDQEDCLWGVDDDVAVLRWDYRIGEGG